MRIVRWPRCPRLRRHCAIPVLLLHLLTGAALASPLLAGDEPLGAAPGPSLHAAVESAWQRSSGIKTLEARDEELAAAADLARSWLGAAPTLGLSERSGRWTGQPAQRETAIALAAPLVPPGQQAARQAFAARDTDAWRAEIDKTRLLVAGEVRQRLWEAAAAHTLLAEQIEHQQHLEQLRDLVARRVKAGDLARSDALLATQEVLAAQVQVAQARSLAGQALARFRLLTGLATLPAPEAETVITVPGTDHALLRASEADAQRARAALRVSWLNVQAAPTVELSLRRERAAPGEAGRSIGFAVQIPLGSSMRNRPATALAATQVTSALALQAETGAAVASEIALAREQVSNADQALEAAGARVTAMREHTALFEQAFALGERGLDELLRSRALTHEAQLSLRQQRIAAGQARAQLNQALGIIP